MSQSKKKHGILKKTRLALIVLSAVLLITATCLIGINETKGKYVRQKHPVYSYKHKAQVNYKVALVKNPFYSQNSLGEGGIYLKNLTDHIDTLFSYEFNGENAGEIHGKYNITAAIICFIKNETGDNVIWQKDYILQPDTNFDANDKKVSLSKEFPVNINDYGNILKQMEQTVGFSFNSKLSITWNVSVDVKTDKGMVNEKLAPNMQIPLNSNYFQISGDLSKDKQGAIEKIQSDISPDYLEKAAIYWAAFGLSTILLLFMLLFTEPLSIDKDEERIKKIFKNHGDRMVAVEGEIETVSQKIIEVHTIDDLVKMADDIGRPILYKNMKQLKNISSFYAIDEKIIYLLDLNKNTVSHSWRDKDQISNQIGQ